MFNVGSVYWANYNATEDIVVNQGGTDSGKTYAIIQLMFTFATHTAPPPVDPIITILSSSVPDSKKGAYRTAKSIANSNSYLQSFIRDWNETDRNIYFKNGWVIEFVGATTEQNAKQGKRQYLFCNEANGIEWPIFWQMAKRTRIRTFLDYNPSAPFWAHDKLIGTLPESNDLSASVKLIISDHRHNPFLSEKDHARTENIQDVNLWRVYARGLTGNLEGLVYPNWKTIPDADFPWDSDSKFAGVDFGYTNDPTGAVRLSRLGNKIFVHELCYETGLGARALRTIFRAEKFGDEDFIYCDHDKDIIREMRLKDLMAVPARKPIAQGIAKVKEYEIYVTASSKNIEFERKRYMWMKDPVTNKFTNTPTEVDNHLMDAIRYGIATHLFRG
jgi:phage terminase large subunit